MYLQLRANSKLPNNLLHLLCIIFALELSSVFCYFHLLPPVRISSLYQRMDCIDEKVNHCVSQLVRTVTAFLQSLVSLLNILIDIQSVSGFVSNLHVSNCIQHINPTYELPNYWWKELLWNKYCSFTVYHTASYFAPWNAREKPRKLTERILYWILYRKLFTWSRYPEWPCSQILKLLLRGQVQTKGSESRVHFKCKILYIFPLH